MEPLQFGRLWQETQEIIRRHAELIWPVAGLFLFVPQLLLGRQMGDRPPATLLSAQATALDLAIFTLVMLLGLFAQLTLYFIAWHDGTDERTFGDILRRSLQRMLPAIALSLMLGIALGFGVLLFVLPALWLLARFIAALPLLVAEEPDPVKALKHSWRLTDGHTLRILGMLAVLFAGLLLLSIAFAGLGAALGVISTVATGQPAQSWGIGRWLFELVVTGVSSAFAVYYVCFAGILSRRLRDADAA